MARIVRIARPAVPWYNEDGIKLTACAERRNVHGGAFSVVAQRMWNSLPVNIPNEENFDTFKFFKLAFY